MKRRTVLALLLVAVATVSTSALAQSAERPTRPPDSYGQWGHRPDGIPQRPAGLSGAPDGQRPTSSFRQHGQRPDNAPQRPAGSYGRRGSR
ncbi:MAG: hypothetical protein FJZ47_11130 [Candidatus Tectomicrobia bacterium]|uniref:Translation initiation factor IF-2 n=1 Tax=Tectimicrobiota bacterium TaxID=2528274 RepID=A0A937W0C5_UNCTE|nr:hypothetical protein [Candidatus Tectomicrobia bacterium]